MSDLYRSVELPIGNEFIRGTVRAPGEGRYPAIIFYHGFSMDRVGQRRLHEEFARECVRNGYVCVRFDFLGLGESDGTFCDMTPSSEVEQAIAIYHWTEQQGFVDSNNIVIVGHSLGGTVAAMTAPVVRAKATVLWAPGFAVYLGAMRRISLTKKPVDGGYDIGGMLMGEAYLEDARHLDLVKRASGYEGRRVLLIQGECDEQVDPASCYLYQDIYGPQMHLEILPGADHQFTTVQWRHKVYGLTINYIKQMVE